jgi:hypothetical protein
MIWGDPGRVDSAWVQLVFVIVSQSLRLAGGHAKAATSRKPDSARLPNIVRSDTFRYTGVLSFVFLLIYALRLCSQ